MQEVIARVEETGTEKARQELKNKMALRKWDTWS